jgi:hypothetical protein
MHIACFSLECLALLGPCLLLACVACKDTLYNFGTAAWSRATVLTGINAVRYVKSGARRCDDGWIRFTYNLVDGISLQHVLLVHKMPKQLCRLTCCMFVALPHCAGSLWLTPGWFSTAHTMPARGSIYRPS